MRTVLDQTAKELDPEVHARLRQARERALRQHRLPLFAGLLLRAPLTAPVTALVGVALIAVVWLSMGEAWFAPGPSIEQLRDLDIVTAPEALELYEDLDFYAWLDSHEGKPG